MNQKKKILFSIVTILLLATIISTVFTSLLSATSGVDYGSSPYINRYDGDLGIDETQFYNSSVVHSLPKGVKDSDDLSIIIQTKEKTLLDEYDALDTELSFKEYLLSPAASAVKQNISDASAEIVKLLDDNYLVYEKGEVYATILSGFEITIKARNFDKLCEIIGDKASITVGEVYKATETQLVKNDVDVYDTGIFNSSAFGYDGSGMVVAVLDTGLDYTHTAFSTSNFKPSSLGINFEEMSALVGNTSANKYENGLTASDVYISEKVPFGYDYADKDVDVFPINSNHGTHVAGVIAGHDDVITGVAPGAQLVIMKIFSDTESTARTSWILGALEDCVNLGVDVINMSIGTSCGFSRELDNAEVARLYEKIRARGISLVVAASNSYNSTYGSEKNGNLGLTSNPDSATIGSPGSYEWSLSVASIEGAETSYMLYGDTIIYFTESSDRVSEEKNFVDDLLGTDKKEIELEYVTIPGAGREADYTGIDVNGKIALVSRGDTTFEEKSNTAEKMGASAVIIYNNVSGDIKMNVGDTKIAVCSISQDDGKMLSASPSGKIKISREQSAGPFISDFSSWGPSPDLTLKPEITAHGGSILSAVPGQDYDRISGTSMATPNISGVTALLRQYVISRFYNNRTDLSDAEMVEVTSKVNRLMMSTADIVYNKNGLPYSVRKQGAGLANLVNSAKTDAYVLTYSRNDGEIMDKSKVELGDDPQKKGVYVLNFAVENFGTKTLSYDVSAIVMTEGVSETKTSHGETTVTESGYILDGATVKVSAENSANLNGNTLTVAPGATAKLSVTVTLGEKDIKYLNESFENGMYVEGYILLNASDDNTVDLNVPYLAFYGDWTEAPLFDIDYFETNKDELDDSIDMLDKTLPDAYATRPIGGISSDYVSYLGSYYYQQKPGTTMISADRKYISLSNQEDAINSFRFVWAGLLRNAAKIVITITDDATGEVVFTREEISVRKSYGDGGSIYPANIDVEFSAIENNLKNNTSYTVTLQGYLDYGDGGLKTNDNNTFTFPLVTDFEAPVVTDCEFYTEYDKAAKKTRLFAKIAVYDNHYSMSMLPGFVTYNSADASFEFKNFEQYQTQIYSSFNSTSYVVYELTDYVDQIKANAANKNTFAVVCYDYALNNATYEIALPADFTDLYFEESTVVLSPNQTYTLSPIVYPGSEWSTLLDFTSTKQSVARVINNEIIAIAPGESVIYATATINGEKKSAKLNVKVLDEGEDGYKRIDPPVAQSFSLTGYTTQKAYYFLATEDRDIGMTGDEQKFHSDSYSLSMYPSESVALHYKLISYFPEATSVTFQSSNDKIVKVDENGIITAVKKGFASISVKVLMNEKSTYYSKSIAIEVKDPFVTSGPSLTHYYGNGGIVTFPSNLAITSIGQYAFSNFDYIDKDPAVDEISEEDPGYTKITYIGDDTIEEVIIPEGVESIGPYAFANLTKLQKITLPSTLVTIDIGAFFGCTSLTTVVGIENVKFINQHAFANCNLKSTVKLNSAVALADYSFAFNTKLEGINLASTTQSIGAFAFLGNEALKTVTIDAEKIKIGQFAFSGCSNVESISINAAVIPTGTFNDCEALTSVTIGKDVTQIGEYAFCNTKLSTFKVAKGNSTFQSSSDGKYLTNASGTEILLIAPTLTELNVNDEKITAIASGAASGNTNLVKLNAPKITSVGDYAFAECINLSQVKLGTLTNIGNYAFYLTSISEIPDYSTNTLGDYAFAGTKITELNLKDGLTVGKCTFEECSNLTKVTIGNNVTIGDYAFRYNRERNFTTGYYDLDDETRIFFYIYTSPLKSLTIGENANIGKGAFLGAAMLESIALGKGAVIGDEAFYNTASLKEIDLSGAVSIGSLAFSGDVVYEFSDQDFMSPATILDPSGLYYDYRYRYYTNKLESVDLSSAASIGDGAFMYCHELKSVNLGELLTEVDKNLFYDCYNLTDINLSKVTKIGEYAFMRSAISKLQLDSITSIEKYAFAECDKLKSIVLGENTLSVEEGAFSYCSKLSKISNLKFASHIGDYAFAYSALNGANLKGAEHIGTHAFYMENTKDFNLVLGSKIKELGDNPFANCIIEPRSKVVVEKFNGVEYKNTVYTFNLSESVRIIDGSIYQVVPNGLELVTYCQKDTTLTVADDTVRIGAMAFMGSGIKNVILPYTVNAIGHKAFYDCDELALVTFTSYNAPILEEEYDHYYYLSGENIPATEEYGGLGIFDYYMWNASSLPSNIYYGANFVDYVGKVDDKIIMVRPANGQNYDSFIFEQYFLSAIDGAAAADDITLAAIEAIRNLPDKVSLNDKALVLLAREAYNKISTTEQKALVTEYSKLTQAEKRIADLEYLANQDKNEDPSPDLPDEPKKSNTGKIILAVCISVAALAAVTISIFTILNYLKKNKKTSSEDSEDEK